MTQPAPAPAARLAADDPAPDLALPNAEGHVARLSRVLGVTP